MQGGSQQCLAHTLLNRPLAVMAPSSERRLLVTANPASLNRGAIWSLKDTSTSSMVMVPAGATVGTAKQLVQLV